MAEEIRQGGYKSLGEALEHYLNPEESNPNTVRRFLSNLYGNARELAGLDEDTIIKNLEDRDAALRLSKHELGKERFTGNLDSLQSRANDFAINLGSNLGTTAPIKKAVSAVISPEERASNLARFMEGSKVTVPVYHGGSEKLSELKQQPNRGSLGALYLTPDKETALKYAILGGVRDEVGMKTALEYKNALRESGIKRSPQLTRAYVNIKNPFDITSLDTKDVVNTIGKENVFNDIKDDSSIREYFGKEIKDKMMQYDMDEEEALEYVLDDLGYEDLQDFFMHKDNLSNYIDFAYADIPLEYDYDSFGGMSSPATSYLHASNKIQEYANKKGFDGIIYDDYETGKKTIVPFSPNQIKSATGNRGTFDQNDPNILHGLGAVGGVKDDKKESRLSKFGSKR